MSKTYQNFVLIIFPYAPNSSSQGKPGYVCVGREDERVWVRLVCQNGEEFYSDPWAQEVVPYEIILPGKKSKIPVFVFNH